MGQAFHPQVTLDILRNAYLFTCQKLDEKINTLTINLSIEYEASFQLA